ncbi:AfsR/SARP family transcriptional regulator [Virgisporangium aurantiacum]|uniref:AfsR/SARP family transcriptional regulator n=1 Tax=Virgisporangium aurantiacum TaxID=175570 RepID=UPI00194F43D5|nr:BTAD domain-containing putative transcriptional regulator [Virgisporangium aurantiacum]
MNDHVAWGNAELGAVPPAALDPPRQCCRFNIRLLGRFELTVGEYQATPGAGVQRLVALLALAGGAVSRRRAAHTLWPDATARRAAANLRSVLYRLQRTNPHLVGSSTADLHLNRDSTVDTQRLNDLARLLLDRSRPCGDAQLSTALSTNLDDDLLPDWPDEEWLQEERERYRQLRLHCLEALCERLVAARWYGAAVDTGLAAVRADPFRESARITLVAAYLAEGNIADARRHYDGYRRRLRDELGVEPGARFGQVVQLHDVRRLEEARPRRGTGRRRARD